MVFTRLRSVGLVEIRGFSNSLAKHGCSSGCSVCKDPFHTWHHSWNKTCTVVTSLVLSPRRSYRTRTVTVLYSYYTCTIPTIQVVQLLHLYCPYHTGGTVSEQQRNGGWQRSSGHCLLLPLEQTPGASGS